MNAVERVEDAIKKAGVRITPEDLPFEIVESDYSYDTTRHGTLARFILRVEIVEHTQTPRPEYVELIAERHPVEGIEEPSMWGVHAVEPKLKTVRVFERKK